jgi:uncharacterized membrane protein
MVHRRDVVPLAMSVDEALTYVISMGVIVPGARHGLPLDTPAEGRVPAP